MNGCIKSYNDRLMINNYKLILEKKINEVLNKIGEDDIGITWYICEDSDIYEMKNTRISSNIAISNSSLLKYTMCKYGCAQILTNNIFIAISAIEDTGTNKSLAHINNSILAKKKNDFLANVIMDELAHVKTLCDHGDKIYDDKLNEYIQKYYDIILPNNII